MTHNYVAVDLGASGGRVLLGQFREGKLKLTEAHRFENAPVREGDSLRWDLDAITFQIHKGIELACWPLRADPLFGASCDSWGVDYVLLGHDGKPVARPFHYRDRRNDGVMEALCARVGRDRVFERTGNQFLPFNTLYQLAAEDPERLKRSARMVMIADYFNHLLGGEIFGEVTLASTTSLLDPRTRRWDAELQTLLPPHAAGLLPQLVEAGTFLGDEEGFPVYASASHDTAAAVAACPGEGDHWAFLSSGTWSLIGVELDTPVLTKEALDAGLGNELGICGTTQLLKNVCGTWPLQQCREEWSASARKLTWNDLIALAEKAKPFASVVDLDDPRFITHGNMLGKLADFCRETNQTPCSDVGETVRVVLEGLALKCRCAVESLERISGRKLTTINMVGGGTQNRLLCQWTADACSRRLVAGPVEATAVGNILAQAIGTKVVKSLADAREVVRQSFSPVEYEPHPSRAWEDAYGRLNTMAKP